MELARIWEVVRRRKWIIGQALLVVTLVAVFGSWVITPSYEASCRVLIKKAEKGGIELARAGLSNLSSIIATSTDVDINKVLAASRPNIEKMVLKLQLRDEDGNLMKPDDLVQAGVGATVKGRIFPRPRLRITQYQDTNVLEIIATSPDAEEAMLMANTLADIMVEKNQTQMRAEYRSARIFLEDEMNKVKGRYHEALVKFNEFQKKESTLNLSAEIKLAIEKMAELMKEKEDNVIDLAEAHAKLNRLKAQLDKLGPDYVSPSSLKESPQIEILKKRLTELSLQLTQATSELTEKHPEIQSLREQIRMAEAELKSELAVYQSSAPELTALQRQIAALDSHLKGVNADIERYLKALNGLPDKAFQQANLDMEINVTQEAYSSLLDSLYQIGIAEATTLSEIRIVEPAVKALVPVSPNKPVTAVLGVFVGLLFGFGLAFIMEYLDDTIRTAEDLREFKPVPLIGTVPEFESDKAPLIFARDPNDPLFESYRKIRNHLMKGDEKPVKTLLVTSAGPGEGKSTTVANLGISAACQDKNVLVVDFDLRRPSLHRYFDIANDAGLADFLQGKLSLDEVIRATEIAGLSVMPSGPPFPDPGRLIESDETSRLVSDLRSRFDVVILDSAPVLVKSDALVLARYVDDSIVVLESEKTTRRAVHELMGVLGKAHIRASGFVLNRFSVQKGKHLYHHQYYGRYGPELSASEGGV
jgi:succinoglycan biosynthesis transport protein ExoP